MKKIFSIYKNYFAIILLIFIFSYIYFKIYNRYNEKIAGVKDQLENLAEKERLNKEYTLLKNKRNKFFNQLFTGDMVALRSLIGDLAWKNKITINSLRPESLPWHKKGIEQIEKLKVTMLLSGGFENIYNFIKALEDIQGIYILNFKRLANRDVVEVILLAFLNKK